MNTRPRIRDRRRAPFALTAITVLTVLTAVATGSCVERVSAEQRGAALVNAASFSPSRFNQYACTTCHRATSSDRPDAILPGGTLAGATARPTFWGGSVVALEDAVGICFEKFMRGGRFDPSTDSAVDLYAYLQSLERAPGAVTTAVSFTIPGTTSPPMAGDASRGATLYNRACSICHGAPRSSSRPISYATVIPDDTEREHTAAMGYTAETLQQVFVEKARHGSFLGFAGNMPPFSTELMTDQDLADIVAYVSPTLR